MKKIIILIIHTLSVLLFSAGLSVIYMMSGEGFGISWIGEQDFAESPIFAEMVNDDIARIKEYAVLRDAFEENGEIANDRTVVVAETTNGRTSYSLRELSTLAAGYGCTMDPETHRISIDRTAEEDDAVNYQLKIEYKLYDPDYYAKRPQGPGQGIMNLRDLSIEAMQQLARYYELDEIFGTAGGNFSYSMHYLNAEGEYRDVYNTEKTIIDLMESGRYLYVTGSGQSGMETNISPIPENAYESPSASLEGPLEQEDEYELIIGIDTSFPYTDRYSEAAASYKSDIDRVYVGLGMLIAGGLAALISLILLFYAGHERGRAVLRPSDNIALELYVFFIALIGIVITWASDRISDPIIRLLAPSGAYGFYHSLVLSLVVYALSIYVLGILIRRYNGGVLWKNTLLCGFVESVSELSQRGSLAAAMLSSYLGVILVNIGLSAAAIYCLLQRFESGAYMIAFCAMCILLLGFDAVVFWRLFLQGKQREELSTALKTISQGETGYEVSEDDFSGRELSMAKDINNISQGLRKALNEQVKAERLRADLITNVSHDIRTPLTSIINYVDLIKRENIQNEKVRGYVDVLDKKSERLRNLTEDLLEASKASSGNVKLEMTKIDLVELSMQAGAEFEDKFAQRSLELCLTTPENPVYILADGRHLWRVLENLYNNAAKYAMENTRIYADVIAGETENVFTIKNISSEKLNISPEELTERFVRGDESRHTEGSGLGLSIAQSLTRLMGGRLEIVIDGDLYKANIHFPLYEEGMESQEHMEEKSLIEIIDG